LSPSNRNATAGGCSRPPGEGDHRAPTQSSRSAVVLVLAAVGAILLFTGFVGLGTWQVERRTWKLDLVARVEERVHARAVMAPARAQWPRLSAATDEYRHVKATGTFLNESETLVQAATELGAGFWVLTPLRLMDGSVVLVNRGFIPPERRNRDSRDAGELVTVTGLLRMTEPIGAFLRRNDAAANRWYSRDVQAIAKARGLGGVAPYFIDADAMPRAEDGSGGGPVGGLTVIAFHNNHLVYAITWYTLALMIAGAAGLALREERRLRHRGWGGIDAGEESVAHD
jgi:surfeit locus 1 family protein